MNSINPKLQFTIEHEDNAKINFLDLTVSRKDDHFEFNIYRKPTTTDTTIHAESHHPIAHKFAAYNSYIHRLVITPLSSADYKAELQTIKFIAQQNGFNPNMVDKLLRKHIKTQKYGPKPKVERRYISAIYTNNMPNIIKQQMAKVNIDVCFKTNNNIQTQLRKKHKIPLDQKTGIYRLNCDSCEKFYIGQTGREFKKRFKEHVPPKRISTNTKIKSNFCAHLIDENHNYTSLENNMKALHTCKKGRYMNALEEYEIYRAFKYDKDNILNEQIDYKSNQLYETALKLLNVNIIVNNNNNNQSVQ